MQKFVSIIIPTYKDWSRLKLCLEALSKQSYPTNGFEVIIVNNEPNDTCPFELPAENMRLISEKHPGSYAARNAGIKTATGDIMAFTDSDCIPDKNWILEGVKMILAGSNTKVVVAGRVELFFNRPDKLSCAETYEKVFAFPYQKKNMKNLGSLVTANAFIPRNIFLEIGLFESRLLSGGDTEFGSRLIASNYLIRYSPDSIILHPARFSVNKILKKKRRTFGGKIYQNVYLKNRNRLIVVTIQLAKQLGRLSIDVFHAWFREKQISVFDRFRITILLILIFSSCCFEGVLIAFTNRARR